MDGSENLSGVHQQVLENRAQAERGEESERAHDQDDGDEKRAEERRGDRERAGGFGNLFLFRQVSGNCENRNHHEEAAEQRGEADR